MARGNAFTSDFFFPSLLVTENNIDDGELRYVVIFIFY